LFLAAAKVRNLVLSPEVTCFCRVALTGAVAWILKENLPGWQAALRAHADRFAALRAQTQDPFLGSFFRLGENTRVASLAGLIAGVLAGYASHLTLDFFTPVSLPIV
jgi:hypothetical protein